MVKAPLSAVAISAQLMKPVPQDPPLGYGPRNYGIQGNKKYRDTDLLIEGAAVAEIQKSFLVSWLEYASWEKTISQNARNWSVYNPKTWFRKANCLQISYYNIPYYCLENDSEFKSVSAIEDF